MKPSDACKIVLLAAWLAACGVFSMISTLQVHGAPPPPCSACTCKNFKAYKAVSAAPVTPKVVWKKVAGSWVLTTYAFTGFLTKNTCDPGVPTQTVEIIDWTTDLTLVENCSATVPPNQTAFIECDLPDPYTGNAPTSNTTDLKRYVCAP